ncbi:hypothetical protein D3C87_1718460 [compost metagenome]
MFTGTVPSTRKLQIPRSSVGISACPITAANSLSNSANLSDVDIRRLLQCGIGGLRHVSNQRGRHGSMPGVADAHFFCVAPGPALPGLCLPRAC